MKNSHRIMAIILVVMLLAALVALGGCKTDDTSDDTGTNGTTATTDDDGADDGDADADDDVVVGDATVGEETIAGACAQCHTLTRIFVQPEMADWNGLILRMESAHGAVLTDQEKADIEAFLGSRQQTETESLVQNKCTECHDLQRLYDMPAGTDWQNVIGTMREKHGAALTDEEQAEIAEYLDSL